MRVKLICDEIELAVAFAIEIGSPHVRFRSIAEVKALNIDVRFTPKSRHSSARAACPLWAKTGRDYMSLDNTEAAHPK